MPQFNGLDYVLLAVIGFSTFSGMSRGLVRQVFDLLAWLLSVYLAFVYGTAVGQELNRLFGLEGHLNTALGPLWGNFSIGAVAINILGFIIVLTLVRVVVEVVAGIMDVVSKLPIISTFNRLGGAALGFLKGTAVVFVIAALLRILPAGEFSGLIEGSYVITTVLAVSPALYEQIRELIGKARALV
jgi:uncharacterized membrane protein required for colicin V production